MRFFFISFSLFIFWADACLGQKFEHLSVPFSDQEVSKNLALVGGISTPRLSNVDLNADGIQDLYIFDREGNVNLTFLSNGSEFEFAPEYAENFPKSNAWVLLRDYNQDGVMDIFASDKSDNFESVRVFKGEFVNDKITFTPYTSTNSPDPDLLYFSSGNDLLPVYVSNIDMPAIDDVDCDGDLDIISFQQSGGYVNFYQNQSMELGYGLDSLIFLESSTCWGGFFESGVAGEIALAGSADDCAENLFTNQQDSKSRLHPGSALLTLDIDNDQDVDLLLADVGFPDVSLLKNEGDCSNTWMNEHVQQFPTYDTAANLGSFPAIYNLDLDHDGINDLAYAPNFVSNSNSQSLWFYKNIDSNETPIYALQNKQFLLDQMIDLGLGANPTFVDYNADGLLDIIIGNLGYRLPSGGLDSRLTLFENKGTAETPVFELVDDDYLGFSRFFGQARDFAPAFGDMDNDGDLDLVVGSSFGKILFAENIAGPNATFEFGEVDNDWFRIRAGQFSTPFIFDVNGDSINDLLVGERLGNINYFQNIGTTESPEFLSNPDTSPNISFFGRIDTRQIGMITGTSAPILVSVEGILHLITGSEHGALEMYEVNLDDLNSEFEAKSLNLGGIDEGFITRPSVADINNDGWYDILVGNKRGGINLYNSNLRSRPDTTTSISQVEIENIKIFPNPAQEYIQVQIDNWQNFDKIRLLDINGRQLKELGIDANHIQIPVEALENGLYFLQISGRKHSFTKRIMIF